MKPLTWAYKYCLRNPLFIGGLLIVISVALVLFNGTVWAAPGQSPLCQTVPPRPTPPPGGETPPPPRGDTSPPSGDNTPLPSPPVIPGTSRAVEATNTPEVGESPSKRTDSANSGAMTAAISTTTSDEGQADHGKTEYKPEVSRSPFRTPVYPAKGDERLVDENSRSDLQLSARTGFPTQLLLPIGGILLMGVGLYWLMSPNRRD